MYGICLIIYVWTWIMQICRQFVSRSAAILSFAKLTSYRPRKVSELRQHFVCTVDFLTTLYQINLQKIVVAKLISRSVNSLPFYRTWRSNIVFTKHPPHWAIWIQSITLRCILIISTNVYIYFSSPQCGDNNKKKVEPISPSDVRI